jgi:hypothetical protein
MSNKEILNSLIAQGIDRDAQLGDLRARIEDLLEKVSKLEALQNEVFMLRMTVQMLRDELEDSDGQTAEVLELLKARHESPAGWSAPS